MAAKWSIRLTAALPLCLLVACTDAGTIVIETTSPQPEVTEQELELLAARLSVPVESTQGFTPPAQMKPSRASLHAQANQVARQVIARELSSEQFDRLLPAIEAHLDTIYRFEVRVERLDYQRRRILAEIDRRAKAAQDAIEKARESGVAAPEVLTQLSFKTGPIVRAARVELRALNRKAQRGIVQPEQLDLVLEREIESMFPTEAAGTRMRDVFEDCC